MSMPCKTALRHRREMGTAEGGSVSVRVEAWERTDAVATGETIHRGCNRSWSDQGLEKQRDNPHLTMLEIVPHFVAYL